MSRELPYPLTVWRSRYGGVYEGGEWVAMNCDPHSVPSEAYSDDVTCATWWSTADRVGVGSTIEEAIAKLVSRLDATP